MSTRDANLRTNRLARWRVRLFSDTVHTHFESAGTSNHLLALPAEHGYRSRFSFGTIGMNLDVNQGRELAYKPPRSMARSSLLRHRSHPFRIRWNLKSPPRAPRGAWLPFPILIWNHWNES